MGYLGLRLTDNWAIELTIPDDTLYKIDGWLRKPGNGSDALPFADESGLGETLIFRRHIISARVEYFDRPNKRPSGPGEDKAINSPGGGIVIPDGLPLFSKEDEPKPSESK